MGKKYCDFYEIILILTSSKALSRSQKDKINGWMAHNSTWSSTSSIGKRMMTMIHLSEVRGYPFKEPSSSASHPLSHSITALKKQLIYSNSLWHSFYYCPGKPAQVSGGGKKPLKDQSRQAVLMVQRAQPFSTSLPTYNFSTPKIAALRVQWRGRFCEQYAL